MSPQKTSVSSSRSCEPGEQALQVRQVAVDIRDGDYAPGVRQLHLLDDGPHQFSLSMSSWSEATPLSVPSSLKPKWR